MKVKYVLDGKPLTEQEYPFPLMFTPGEGLVLESTAYVIVSSEKDADGLVVVLKEQSYCGDCDMAIVSPSNRAFCKCDEKNKNT